ncbi:phage holin family protein [Flavobacterium sp.]|uniref:phage holin family protein n=1 Tax=Flavobacterium sp. TaxID=239 RepID=UPI00286C2FF0|nr:phage holin family protein [Flavobacterium sp.]
MNHIKEHESLLSIIGKALLYIFRDTYTVSVGAVVSFIGYLLPVRDIVNLLIGFFIVDVIFGYWAAKKLRKERFSVKIIWEHTIPRMLVSVVLITGAFTWDKVYEQDFISTYKIIGWFISGVLLCSIADNGYQITKWSIFPKLGKLLNDKVKESTGLEINDEKKEKL